MEEWERLGLKALGAFMGVLASLVIIAPANVRNGVYRFAVGFAMGVIFAPAISQVSWLWFLHGATNDMIIARSAACGFVVWSILEIIARALSSEKVISQLIDELVRLRKGK